jgi:hypothetical protein
LLVVTILGAITVTLPFLLSRKIVVSPTGEIEEHKKETGSAPGAAVVFFLGLFLSLAIGIVLGNSLEKFLCPILNEVWYKYVGYSRWLLVGMAVSGYLLIALPASIQEVNESWTACILLNKWTGTLRYITSGWWFKYWWETPEDEMVETELQTIEISGVAETSDGGKFTLKMTATYFPSTKIDPSTGVPRIFDYTRVEEGTGKKTMASLILGEATKIIQAMTTDEVMRGAGEIRQRIENIYFAHKDGPTVDVVDQLERDLGVDIRTVAVTEILADTATLETKRQRLAGKSLAEAAKELEGIGPELIEAALVNAGKKEVRRQELDLRGAEGAEVKGLGVILAGLLAAKGSDKEKAKDDNRKGGK